MRDHLKARICPDCGMKKAGSDFPPVYAKDGNRIVDRRPLCKACDSIANQKRKQERKVQERFDAVLALPWGERILLKEEKERDIRLKTQYGVTSSQYRAMVALQNGVCAICKQPERVRGKLLCVDHDHQTGSVRGLLCSHCNLGLGLFGDDDKKLEKAAQYLRSYKSWDAEIG